MKRIAVPLSTRLKDSIYDGAIVSGGFYDKLLTNLSNRRRWRWNAYRRACRAIPRTSPVHGCMNWEKINDRRCALIEARPDRDDAEFRALQKVASAVVAPGLVTDCFLLKRVRRNIKREIAAK